MSSKAIWLTPHLSDEIIKNDTIFNQIQSIISDITLGHTDMPHLLENLGGVLTNKEPQYREKGMRFFTKVLKELPKDLIPYSQLKFIVKFYIDRLKDNHRVVPAAIEGYLALIEMKDFSMENTGEFFTILFREVNCQSQVRQDRHNIYMIIKKLLERDIEHMKKMGPDFVYGFISAMDGERDPRNLMFLFSFLPKFISNIPLGHLVEEMFEVISCYYPIDFHPSPDDPAAVSRDELAAALAPCLCATPEFGEHCLALLIEKLDSSLRIAKLDSLNLLIQSCEVFQPESYVPFLKGLWSSIHREISHKTDEELKTTAHIALSALVRRLSSAADKDQSFEHFVKGILISMQTSMAEATTVAQFIQAGRVLLTTANASKESCILVARTMIPGTIAYYNFKTSDKLQISSLQALGEIYDLTKHWNVTDEVKTEVNEILQLCLIAVSQVDKEYQIAGFKTLIKVKDALTTDLIVPFVEILVHNIQHSDDNDLLTVSIEAVNAIARIYPDEIMTLVVKGKCDLENLNNDKTDFEKRLYLLCNLASIDDFTKTIIQEILKLVANNDCDAKKIVEALSSSISNSSLYTQEKLTQIESDHGLIESILQWLTKEVNEVSCVEVLNHGFSLIATTIASLPAEKQAAILEKHSRLIIENCKMNEPYFLILESMYSSIHQNVYNSYLKEILDQSLEFSLNSDSKLVRAKACCLISHLLNKAEYPEKFELLYESLRNYLSSCSKDDLKICPKLIFLYGWITKGLIMRGSDIFTFWLQKITVSLSSSEYCGHGAEAIKLIMTDDTENLSVKQNCRVSRLYKQRMFQTFTGLSDKLLPLKEGTKEAYYLSWAYIIGKVPKSVLNNETVRIVPIVIESLEYDNSDLLVVMVDILSHIIQINHGAVASSLQTILPRLILLTKYVKSMDVRIKSLQCLFDIANTFPTVLLLPFKTDLLHDLAPSLDDKKRLVRNMAVRARTRWFLIGAPGEAKEN